MSAWDARLRSTFDLWREFGSLTHRSIELLERPDRGLLRWIVDSVVPDKTLQRRRAVVKELELRYEGLLNQLWAARRVESRPPQSETEQREQGEVRIWQRLQDQSRVPIAAKHLPGCFWDACEEQYEGAVKPLKLRFMLRPFVDSIPAGGADFLRTLAYNASTVTLPRDRETLRSLNHVFPAFHQALLNEVEDLETWTAGMVTPAEVRAQVAPYTSYLAWLFTTSPPPLKGAPP